MIIICPCGEKKFQIEDKLIPTEGRLLQCGSCNKEWFFKKEKIEPTKSNTQELIKKPQITENLDINKRMTRNTINQEITVAEKKPKSSKKSSFSELMSFSFNSSCFAGPIIEKSLILLAVIKKFLNVFFSSFASGFKIKAYLLFTVDKPKLFPFA